MYVQMRFRGFHTHTHAPLYFERKDGVEEMITLLHMQCEEGLEEPLLNTVGAVNNMSFYSDVPNRLLAHRKNIAGARTCLVWCMHLPYYISIRSAIICSSSPCNCRVISATAPQS